MKFVSSFCPNQPETSGRPVHEGHPQQGQRGSCHRQGRHAHPQGEGAAEAQGEQPNNLPSTALQLSQLHTESFDFNIVSSLALVTCFHHLHVGQILDEIDEHGIKIYHLPDAESDEDEDFKEQTRILKVTSSYCL